MKKAVRFLAMIFILAICLSSVSIVDAEMIKEACIGVFENAPSEAEIEREYLRYHGPEITMWSGPWMRRYQLWLPYEPPEEAVERFGAVRGRYAELWYGSKEEYLDRPNLEADGIYKKAPETDWHPIPWEQTRPEKRVVVMVPCNPTETFYNSRPEREDTTFIRWVTAIKYPEGVSTEEGEKWFLDVHAKEAVDQPGLLKFVSHRVIDELSHAQTGQNSWIRINEYWYKDIDAWREAVIESPPKYTVPSWGGEYPFVEMRSTFIPFYHYVDFLKGDYVVPGR